MTRGRLLAVVAFAVGACVVASPVSATSITMDFSGTVDLSGVGGLASNTFSGSVTWDPTQAPWLTACCNVADYNYVSETLIIDGVDVSADVAPPASSGGTGHLATNFTPLPPIFDFFFPFSSALNVHGALIDEVGGGIHAPWTSLALPSDLSPLSLVTSEASVFISLGSPEVIGTLNAVSGVSAPEPASLTLLGIGLSASGLIARRRRRARS